MIFRILHFSSVDIAFLSDIDRPTFSFLQPDIEKLFDISEPALSAISVIAGWIFHASYSFYFLWSLIIDTFFFLHFPFSLHIPARLLAVCSSLAFSLSPAFISRLSALFIFISSDFISFARLRFDIAFRFLSFPFLPLFLSSLRYFIIIAGHSDTMRPVPLIHY